MGLGMDFHGQWTIHYCPWKIRVRVRVQLLPIDPNPNPNWPWKIIVHEMYIVHVIYL